MIIDNFNFRKAVLFHTIRYALYVLLILLCGCATTQPAAYKKPTGEYVWPPPPAAPRIKWLTEWSSRYDFGGEPSKLLTFLVGRERVEKLNRPNGVVADSAGNVYVADSAYHIIFVFDQEKKALRFLGLGTLAGPVGLAIDDKRGVLYVSDARLKKVFGFDKNDGRTIMVLGGPGEFESPAGMVFDDVRDRLYLADTRNHVVKVYDKDGRPLFTIGKRGNGDGEFNFPSYLALDRDGRLYVVDSFNFRVQIFDPEGKFLKKFGSLGDASGYFSRPAGIGVDSDGHIYVVDASFNNFQIFNQDGKLLLWIGNVGRNPGEFYLPSGMYIDKRDRIYVSDTFNRRVQVFQYLAEKK
jgi:DNA-binding beta-propeller fold protein YncE